MARLFISYRRSDTEAFADRLAQRLASFQFEMVFVASSAIDLGSDYADQIRSSLSGCSAVLVLIGKGWIDARDDGGGRRLDDPADWVRREVALALRLGLPVIPVLFDSAPVPKVEDLPLDLAPLATKQGYDINGKYFDRDADELGRRVEALIVARERESRPSSAMARATGTLGQLKIIWLALFTTTGGVAVAPQFVPALPGSFWVFPATMTLAAFSWWLYWLGESARPSFARAS
jgi:TIR domain